MEKLRGQIVDIIQDGFFKGITSSESADKILALFDDWKSPEEVAEMINTIKYWRGYEDGYYKTKGTP